MDIHLIEFSTRLMASDPEYEVYNEIWGAFAVYRNPQCGFYNMALNRDCWLHKALYLNDNHLYPAWLWVDMVELLDGVPAQIVKW